MAQVSADDCTAARSPGRLIRRIDKLMSGMVEARLPPGDINLSQWIALKLVRDGTATNPGALARELGHTTGATTRLIDGLEQRGLMGRDRAGMDRRVVTLAVTDTGHEKLKVLTAIVVGVWNEVIGDFAQDEFQRLINDMEKLLTAVERKAGEALSEELAA